MEILCNRKVNKVKTNVKVTNDVYWSFGKTTTGKVTTIKIERCEHSA